MLEKIGLPSKPSLRRGTWAVDGTHCHGCTSQFTFFNRKHHCRRCEGLFCNACTHQRMVLRGQGDSFVRICDPCKKMETAARYELRHQNKHKGRRAFGLGTSKSDSNFEVEKLCCSTGMDDKTCSSSRQQQQSSESKFIADDLASVSPENLLQQASDEKKKYRSLKAEGKPEEALKAFKRGKELERQAGVLQTFLRQNRSTGSPSSTINKTQNTDVRRGTNVGNEGGGFMDELKQLGWGDWDADSGVESHSLCKSQIVEHKKKALAWKREGKLAEAKEELKKAKMLEKKMAEEEELNVAADSDDELSFLIDSINNERDDADMEGAPCSEEEQIPSQKTAMGLLLELQEAAIDDQSSLPCESDVTDQDMNDPSYLLILRNLGWKDEEKEEQEYDDVDEDDGEDNDGEDDDDLKTCLAEAEKPFRGQDRFKLQQESLSHKRSAMKLRREGRLHEAEAEFELAKSLESQLEAMGIRNDAKSGAAMAEASNLLAAAAAAAAADVDDDDEDDDAAMELLESRGLCEERIWLEQQIKAAKMKALSLKRLGKQSEALDALRQAKLLEKKLKK